MKIFNVLIVVAVFSLVLISSFLILEQSLLSNTSNIKLASKYIQKQPMIVKAESLNSALKITCENLRVMSPNLSVVKFLEVNKINSSYDFRKTLATKIGIKNYTGKILENKNLFQYLIKLFLEDKKCESS